MDKLSRFLKDIENFLSAATSSANELYCTAQSMGIVKDVEQSACYESSMTNIWSKNDELYIAISSTLNSKVSYKLSLTSPNDAYQVGVDYYSSSSDKWEKAGIMSLDEAAEFIEQKVFEGLKEVSPFVMRPYVETMRYNLEKARTELKQQKSESVEYTVHPAQLEILG